LKLNNVGIESEDQEEQELIRQILELGEDKELYEGSEWQNWLKLNNVENVPNQRDQIDHSSNSNLRQEFLYFLSQENHLSVVNRKESNGLHHRIRQLKNGNVSEKDLKLIMENGRAQN